MRSNDGIHNWTRVSNDPVIGNGFGGMGGFAARPTGVIINGLYNCYFQGPSFNVYRATSGDGSTYTTQGIVIAAGYPASPGQTGWITTGWKWTGSLWMVTVNCFAGNGLPADTDRMFSTGDGSAFTFLYNMPSLNQYPGGMYGRGQFKSTSTGLDYMFYESNRSNTGPPVDMYRALASSQGLFSWFPDPVPVVTLAGNHLGLASPGSLSDVCPVDLGNKTGVFFTAADATNGFHAAGLNLVDVPFDNWLLNTTPVPSSSSSLYLRDSLKLRLK
jgi:hypothetical protein